MRESSARAVSPRSDEPGAAAAPNALTRILREWPDTAARAAIVAVACTLFWLTWAHWGSIQVDCGREVYVPYQILRGKLLYRDLWYPYGPLEPYISALLLKVFGEHLSVLYYLGFSLAVTCALVLFNFGKMLGVRAVGLAAALILLLQGFRFTIFNYIFPYTYSAPMGLLFNLVCLLFTMKHVLGRPKRNLVIAGVAAGLSLITKQEMGIACYIMLTFVVLMEAVLQRSTRTLFRGIAGCAPGLAIAAAVYGWFFWKVTPEVILQANWQFAPGSYFLRTYGASMSASTGFRFIPGELLSLIVNGTGALFAWFFIAKASRHLGRWPFVIAVTCLTTLLGLVHYYSGPMGRANNIAWYVLLFPRGLFFIGIGFLVYTLNELRKRPDNRRSLAEIGLALFAVVSGIRVLAETAPFDYSIYYTVPLLLVFLIAVTRCFTLAAQGLPSEQRGTLVSLLLAAEVILLAAVNVPIESGRNTKFQTTWGSIYLTSEDARTSRQIYDFILDQKQHARRVVLIPELPMMYALTDTEAPSRWYSLVVGYLSPEQEESYVAELNDHVPDYIVYCNWQPHGPGTVFAGDFGKDYDRKIYHWLETNYRVVGELGHFRADRSQPLAALLYQRRDAPPPAAH